MRHSKVVEQAILEVSLLNQDSVLVLLEKVTMLLGKEPRLIQLPKKKLVFIGDTHGDWEATQALLHQYWDSSIVFVFLGDYVDRGPNQIKNINLLYHLKLKAPDRLILLRGNHEVPSVNHNYGFYAVVEKELGETYSYFAKSFAELPLAAVSEHLGIFAVHGGLAEDLQSIEAIDVLPREIEPNHPIIFQMLWNDPKETLQGFAPSIRGGRARVFGKDVTEVFLANNRLNLIIRAHEVFSHGFYWFFDGLILSLFSARNYRRPIAGKVLYVDDTGNREIRPV